jgi:hypothetical protein
MEDAALAETLDISLELHAESTIGDLCSCGLEQCTVHCYDCLSYKPTCRSCFIDHHKNTPFHWARVWSNQLGYFEKMDRSALTSHGVPFDLGHYGDPCPNWPTKGPDHLTFSVDDINGVHQTRIRFCWCHGPPDKSAQLKLHRLFPSTSKDSQSAFTFALLKLYSIQTMQGKISATDFFASLRRTTDNANPDNVPVSANEFKPLCLYSKPFHI